MTEDSETRGSVGSGVGTKKVVFEREKRLGIVTLDNGDFNVFDVEQIYQFRDLMRELQWDEKVRAIVIKGRGARAFSSG